MAETRTAAEIFTASSTGGGTDPQTATNTAAIAAANAAIASINADNLTQTESDVLTAAQAATDTTQSTDITAAQSAITALQGIDNLTQAESDALVAAQATLDAAQDAAIAALPSTDAQIKAAYESNANTNAFTDAEQTKLTGIEAGATGDQTAAEIKTAYEGNANTNAFTDVEQTKLAGIEPAATGDQTGAEIKALYEAEGDTNAFSNSDKSKLDFIAATQAVDLDALETAVNALGNAVVFRGGWDASAGTFPGGGTAVTGDTYRVSVGGTVDGVAFAVGDAISAIVDNASSATYSANWFKEDNTDQVTSVAGQVGGVTAAQIATATSADAILASDNPTGDGGTATTLARSDHKHAQQDVSAYTHAWGGQGAQSLDDFLNALYLQVNPALEAPTITTQATINTAVIGQAITFTPPVVTGNPAPTITYTLDSDTVAQGDETFVLTEALDGQTAVLDYVVSNGEVPDAAGSSAGVTIVYAAPTAASGLADQAFTANSGNQTFDPTGDFTVVGDADLSGGTWSLPTSVAGVTIAPTTGLITFDTNSLAVQAGTAIVVRLTNSGGQVDSGFSFDIGAVVPTLSNFVINQDGTGSLDVDVDCTIYFRRDPQGTNPDGAACISGAGALETFSLAVTAGTNNLNWSFALGLDGTFQISAAARVEPSGSPSNVVTDNAVEIDTQGDPLDSSTPADGATGFAVDANISVNAGDNVAATGSVVLRIQGGATIETFDLSLGTGDNGGTVTRGAGEQTTDLLTFNPGADLSGLTTYEIDLTNIEDEAGNAFTGDLVIAFTTAVAPSAGAPSAMNIVSIDGVATGGALSGADAAPATDNTITVVFDLDPTSDHVAFGLTGVTGGRLPSSSATLNNASNTNVVANSTYLDPGLPPGLAVYEVAITPGQSTLTVTFEAGLGTWGTRVNFFGFEGVGWTVGTAEILTTASGRSQPGDVPAGPTFTQGSTGDPLQVSMTPGAGDAVIAVAATEDSTIASLVNLTEIVNVNTGTAGEDFFGAVNTNAPAGANDFGWDFVGAPTSASVILLPIQVA